MSQGMNVLCCYSCRMYQVHIMKKARKWQCKLCNAKQSLQQIYFQGSGKDCRLHVQHLNYLKANDTSISFISEQENCNDNCNATNIAQELDIENPIKNKRAKYLDLPKKESPSDVEDSSSDNICQVEDVINKKSLCNATNNDSCNFENNFENEDIANKRETLSSIIFNYNSSIEDKCNLQDTEKSSKEYNNAANMFETYSELDDPLI